MSCPSGRLRANKRSKNGVRYVTVYRHYLTGKLMRASDYGYKAWPFGRWK